MTQTVVKERAIAFQADSVQGILDGTKTQTRRVAPIQWDTSKHWGDYNCWTFSKRGRPFIGFTMTNGGHEAVVPHCSYGRVGDRLWVRETWALGRASFEKRTDVPLAPPQRGGASAPVIYKAQGLINADEFEWTSPRYMPRWASRITLEILEVRVQRLQDISHEDAVAEGCYRIEPCKEYPNGNAWGRAGYAALWDSLNEERGHSWESNPWCWAISFKLVK